MWKFIFYVFCFYEEMDGFICFMGGVKWRGVDMDRFEVLRKVIKFFWRKRKELIKMIINNIERINEVVNYMFIV